MHRIPVRQIMHDRVITIRPDALAADVLEAETAGSQHSSYEPGVEEEWLDVDEIMTRYVITTCPDATVGELVTEMLRYKIGGMPVVEAEDGNGKRLRVIGIVTETDIFAMIAAAWEADHAQKA